MQENEQLKSMLHLVLQKTKKTEGLEAHREMCALKMTTHQ